MIGRVWSYISNILIKKVANVESKHSSSPPSFSARHFIIEIMDALIYVCTCVEKVRVTCIGEIKYFGVLWRRKTIEMC